MISSLLKTFLVKPKGGSFTQRISAGLFQAGLFLLMSVLSQTLLALVRGHLVFLSFLSTRHNSLVFVSPFTGEGFT